MPDVTISVAIAGSILSAVVSGTAAWKAFQHRTVSNEKRIKSIENNDHDERLRRLESWRDREIGEERAMAKMATRQHTDRFSTAADSGEE